MKHILSLAIVGCGDISRFTALGCLLNPRLRAAVCVDTDEGKAAAFARRFRIPRFSTDYYDVLSGGGIDAVYLAVPHYLHYPFMKAAVEKGLPILCEKPVTTSLHDALEIVDMATGAKVKIGVNYQYRYDRGIYSLTTAARRGDLGRILYGRCNIPWHREASYFTGAPWHAEREKSGGGTLITQASHFIDAALKAFQSKPVRVSGQGRQMKFTETEVEDFFMGTVQMERGEMLEVVSSMVSEPRKPATVEIYGVNGTGIYHDSLIGKLRFYGNRPRRKSPPVRGIHALFRSLEGFRRWVFFDQPYLMPVEETLPVMAVIDALYKSAEKGGPVDIDRAYETYTYRM